MQYTTNYKFKKPEDSDFFDVKDFGDMMDAADTQLKKQENSTANIVNDAKNQAQEAVKEAVADAKEAAEAVVKGKANKDKKITVTISASKWTTTAPYTNTMSITGITATNKIGVIPRDNWTEAQADAWMSAAILSGTQGVGTLTLKARGDKPAIDIPIDILIGDEVS